MPRRFTFRSFMPRRSRKLTLAPLTIAWMYSPRNWANTISSTSRTMPKNTAMMIVQGNSLSLPLAASTFRRFERVRMGSRSLRTLVRFTGNRRIHLSNGPDGRPAAFAGDDADLGPARDRPVLGDDLHAFAAKLADPARPQLAHGHAPLPDEDRLLARLGRLLPVRPEDQSARQPGFLQRADPQRPRDRPEHDHAAHRADARPLVDEEAGDDAAQDEQPPEHAEHAARHEQLGRQECRAQAEQEDGEQ